MKENIEINATVPACISYADLSRRVGSMVLNNSIHSWLGDVHEFEQVNGDARFACGLTEDGHDAHCDDACTFEEPEVYQEFIISERSAKLLQEYTHELVYHCEELSLYLWGVTHYGTPWNGVMCTLKKPF